MSELRDAVARLIKYAPLTVQYTDGGYAAQPFVTVLTETGQAVVDLVEASVAVRNNESDTPEGFRAADLYDEARARVMELAGRE